MPLWVKITLGFIGGLILLLILVFCLSLWIIRVPKIDFDKRDSDAAEKLEDWFAALHKQRVVPFNGAVFIRQGDDVLLRKVYGTDSQGRELTLDSPLRLASVSKQFTAVGILTLVESRKIDLDAPISTYLPSCDFSAPVRSLLNHTSGIPNQIYHKADKIELLTLEKVETLMCDGSVVQGEQNFEYSNTGYLLAACMIERVTGESFEDYMQSAVFDALDMNQSRVWNLISTRPFPTRAGSFKSRKGVIHPLEPLNLDGVAGDGGVFSTIKDLENWDRFWSDDRLISRDLKDLAMTPEDGDYAFGWVKDGESIWHNGSWLGARTYIGRNLKTSDLIILLDNSSNPQIDTIVGRISEFLEN